MKWHAVHEKCLTRMFKWTHRAFSSTRLNLPPYLMSIMGTHFRFINLDRFPKKTDKYSTEKVNFESRDYIYKNISPVIYIYRYLLQVHFLLYEVFKIIFHDLSVELAMNIISEIDTLSESRTTPVWKFLKVVEYKIEKLRELSKSTHVLQPKETKFRDMIFPGDTELRLLGRSFTGGQKREHNREVS